MVHRSKVRIQNIKAGVATPCFLLNLALVYSESPPTISKTNESVVSQLQCHNLEYLERIATSKSLSDETINI